MTNTTIKTITCKFRRYRYSAEKDCIELKSPSGKIKTVMMLSCRDNEGFWKFSSMFREVDKLGEFTTDKNWRDINISIEDMKQFASLK